MNNAIPTDDDRQTPSYGQDSSDDISSVSTDKLLPTDENNQRRWARVNGIRMSQVKVDNRTSQPSITIKYRYRPNDKKQYIFNGGKRIITNEHVKITRLSQSKLRSLNQNIPVLKLDSRLTQKNTNNATVSYPNKKQSQNEHENLSNQETEKMASKQNILHVNHTPTAAGIHQATDQKLIVSKRTASKLSVSNKPLVKMNQKQISVSVKRIFLKAKESS